MDLSTSVYRTADSAGDIHLRQPPGGHHLLAILASSGCRSSANGDDIARDRIVSRPVATRLTSANLHMRTARDTLPHNAMNRRGGNGLRQHWSWDQRYWLTENKLSTPQLAPVADYPYGYDASGTVTAQHDALEPARNRDFGYDDLNRLTVANSGSALWGAGG